MQVLSGRPREAPRSRDRVDQRARERRARSVRDLGILLVVVLAGYATARWFDLFEPFDRWVHRHEAIQVDELIPTAFLSIVGLAIYACRRSREAQAEACRRAAIEQDLAHTTDRYRSLFEYYPYAVFSLDLEGRYREVNPAGERLSGLATDELLATDFASVIAPEDLERVTAAFLRAAEREAQQLEAKVLRADGERRDISITALPMVVAGEVVGVYGVAEDITEDKQVRRELDLARQSAEAANEAKSLFLANMSHEIRTPLTSVIGATELLADTELDAMQGKLVNMASRNGRALLRLVDEILDFSRIEAGQVEVETAPFDLVEAVRQASDPAELSARAKGLAFHTDLDPGLPRTVVGDAGRLGQVLGNLIGNAVKFTEEGWIRLTATCHGADADGLEVRFAVQDSGIGIAAEDRDRLFESFAQVDPSSTRRYGGAGLGLAISHQLVTLMGGTLWVDSEPGVGSTFSFRLPLGRPPRA